MHIAPAPAAGQHPLRLLVIRAFGNDAQNEQVSFHSRDTDISLSQPVVLLGSAIELLDPVPGDLTFNNAGPDAVRVKVLVGRNA